ncbi:hypothetical protein [Rhizobacter fulvus]
MTAHPHIACDGPTPPRWLLPVAARGPPAAARTTAPLPLDLFFLPSEFSMTNAVLRPPIFNRKPLAAIALLALLTLGLCVAMPGYALDLVAFTGITGPMVSALTQIAALGPGIKALVGFVGFVVALISLSALRNFGPVLFYVGLAIFAAVGLVIAGAIMGAVI